MEGKTYTLVDLLDNTDFLYDHVESKLARMIKDIYEEMGKMTDYKTVFLKHNLQVFPQVKFVAPTRNLNSKFTDFSAPELARFHIEGEKTLITIDEKAFVWTFGIYVAIIYSKRLHVFDVYEFNQWVNALRHETLENVEQLWKQHMERFHIETKLFDDLFHACCKVNPDERPKWNVLSIIFKE
jgi:hypothetical protein